MKRILIATDHSSHAERAAAYGAMLARLFDADIELITSVYISPLPLGPYNVAVPTDYLNVAREQGLERLDQFAATLRGDGLRVTTMVVHEDPASAIRARAEEIEADLVVLGTRGHTGLAHVLFGSVAERVARLVPNPVLTAHSESPPPAEPRTILVPTDFSHHAETALEWATGLARVTGAKLALMHSTYLQFGGQESLIITDASIHEAVAADARRQLDELASGIHGIEVECEVLRTPPDMAVLDAARKCAANLIVIGTRGRTGLAHVVLGSVAERVIRRSEIPVVSVKAAD